MCHFVFVSAAHFAKTPMMLIGRKMTPAHTQYACCMSLVHTVRVWQSVSDCAAVSMQVCDSSCICHSFFLGCVCHVWLKLTPVRRLVHPSSVSPIPPRSLLLPLPPLLHPSITPSSFSFLLAIWQHRRICSLKVPPSLSGSRGWRFRGNSVRVDWAGADRWLPFIGLHHWSIKSNQTGPVCTHAPLCSHPEWTVPPDTREY